MTVKGSTRRISWPSGSHRNFESNLNNSEICLEDSTTQLFRSTAMLLSLCIPASVLPRLPPNSNGFTYRILPLDQLATKISATGCCRPNDVPLLIWESVSVSFTVFCQYFLVLYQTGILLKAASCVCKIVFSIAAINKLLTLTSHSCQRYKSGKIVTLPHLHV